jgi:hypothetical protein
MGYRKSEIKSEINERDCPYIIELAVPDGGLGRSLDAMAVFHANMSIEMLSGCGRYDEPRHYVRWCFGDLLNAASFQALFGGKLVTELFPSITGANLR